MKFLRYLSYLKRISFFIPKTNDILIYDVVGSEEMKIILFPHREATVLPVRGEVFSIHPAIFLDFFYFRFIKRTNLRLAYDLAFIKAVKPQIVITLIDNNHTFHKLAQYYPAHFVCIQNGFRSHRCADSFEKFPILFCFGQRDIDLYQQHKITFQKVFPVGSLRSSYFVSTIAPTLDNETSYDICLVSEYLQGMEKDNYEVNEEGVRLLHKWLFISCDYLKRYLSEKNLSLVIAGRQREGDNQGEIEFYNRYFGDRVKVFPSNKSYLNSYRLAYKSSVVICYFSTLGLEALTWGKKVLFYPHPKEKNLAVDNSHSHFFKTQTDSYMEFQTKMDTLIQMTVEEYRMETRKDTSYLMSDVLSAQVIIREFIEKQLE